MPFPTTPVLDDFNRADLASLGPTYGANVHSAWPSFSIASNQASNGVTAFRSNYWLEQFQESQECYATLAVAAMPRMLCRLQNPGASPNYYEFSAAAPNAFLVRTVAGARTQLGANLTYTPAIGDMVGLQVEGAAIRAWLNVAGGGWTLLGERTDSAIPGAGWIGFAAPTVASNIIDDFGGGGFSGRPLHRMPLGA